ncbi:ceramide-1-phosphate transfer protein, partial [Pygocentrus nattereri]|uniref:ceramide-1-phosphate transfer protein n=1 Tax=Pygocentrus nattereri TaxID=42514 RepID=UPI001891CD46
SPSVSRPLSLCLSLTPSVSPSLPSINLSPQVEPAAAEGRLVSASVDDEYIINNNIRKDAVLGVCPAQKFQVSRLLLYLNSALGPASDVMLEPYLLCWEELIKFMEALGPLVSFFTGKVQEKITLIRRLVEEEAANFSFLTAPDSQVTPNPQWHAYSSVRSMLVAELQRGVVNFDRRTDSGSRTLLRLHRSLLWLQLLLEKVVDEGRSYRGRSDGGHSLGALCAEAYVQALAPHHPWLLQQAAQLAFKAMPSRAALLPIVCVHTQEEAEPIILLIISAIREVHRRTQRELEQRSMMDLP